MIPGDTDEGPRVSRLFREWGSDSQLVGDGDFKLMEDNTERIFEDVSWLIEKFDYRNKDADWRNSRDAVQRGMQKIKGGYPGDPVYKMNK